MSRHALVLASLLVLSTGAAAQDAATELTDAERSAIVAEIESRHAAAIGYATRGEGLPPGEFYHSNLERYFHGEPATFLQGVRLLGTVEEMEGFFENMASSRRGTPMETLDSRVAVLSRDMALHVTRGHFSVVNSEGVEGDTFPFSTTSVWVRGEDGQWRMLHTHQSWTNTPVEGG